MKTTWLIGEDQVISLPLLIVQILLCVQSLVHPIYHLKQQDIVKRMPRKESMQHCHYVIRLEALPVKDVTCQ